MSGSVLGGGLGQVLAYAPCWRIDRREIYRPMGVGRLPEPAGCEAVLHCDDRVVMFKYVNSDLGELAHQLTLSPRHLRVRQIEGIDRILDLVDSAKTYPYDWVCYHITGRRPLKQNQKPSISGVRLTTDLPTMAEHITRKRAPTLAELPGEYQTHEALSANLGVSTKTIRRWRCRGLLGLRAVCDDGVCRLVFSAKAVRRFEERNSEMVKRGASFTLLTDAEKVHIVDLARQILGEKRRKLHIVSREIAARMGRAVETVRYTLRQYDAANPDQALFANNGEPVVSRRHLAIWRSHRRGESVDQIARAMSCGADSVLAVVREMQARVLKDTPLEYIDNELFHAPNADALILDAARPEPPEPADKPTRAPAGLPTYLRALYETPLLTREQEVDVFRRFNYLRFKVARGVEALDVYTVTQESLDEIYDWRRLTDQIKNEIIQANLRLVVSIAKRHVGRSDNIFEVISDGNMSLMRAVEKFDFSMGNKFSTYGSWSIMKNFARTVPERHYHLRRFVTGQDEMLDATAGERIEETSPSDMEHVRTALSSGLDQLTDREQTIVTHHYGLLGAKGGTSTLEELGRRFGVTKERIRQIEKRAISKLSSIVSPTLLEAFAN